MTLPKLGVELTNWSKSVRAPCFVYQAHNATEIAKALRSARAEGLSVIAHGAGHSYTDAALNTRGVVIDVTPMNRILAWDAAHGIMRVEPGVTLGEVVQVAAQDGWWPFVTPSTPAVTMGGCTAMNVNGKNGWKEGVFGEHILALDVLLASGETRTLTPQAHPQLFYAFVGSLGLLGMMTAITLQLRPVAAGGVAIRRHAAASVAELLALFAAQEQQSDFMEGWIDGFATGAQLGRGILTCATLERSEQSAPLSQPVSGPFVHLPAALVKRAAPLLQPVRLAAGQMLNRILYGLGRCNQMGREQSTLFPYTFWPALALTGYQALFPEGIETFQAFVPRQSARETFERILTYSQQQGCAPLWCVVKQHRRDPFLLSYQVDGFSLEMNYARSRQSMEKLERIHQELITTVIRARGRFYLAKDGLLTQAQYRQSVGDEAIDTFLQLKQCYDPEMVWQSDLFRRLFRPSLPGGERSQRQFAIQAEVIQDGAGQPKVIQDGAGQDTSKERYALSGIPVGSSRPTAH